MKHQNLIPAIEAILFSSGEPVAIKNIAKIFEISELEVENIINNIIDKFSDENSGIKIIKIKDKYQMCSKSEYGEYVSEILNINRNTRLSPSAMEVLAIVAYNEPVTKSFIEKVRGVDCSRLVNNLVEKNLIKEKGRLDVPGRPIIYETTENFLRCFGISCIDELPKPEIQSQNHED